jgi:proliferating cell nuclear antigen
LVKSVNFEASSNGLSMQAMDSSHVALVSFHLDESGFTSYRCDRQITLGVSIENLSKILKCAANDDSITLQAEDEPSTIRFTFEGQSNPLIRKRTLLGI